MRGWVAFYKTSGQASTNMLGVYSAFEAEQLNEFIKAATAGTGRMCGCCTTWTHCFSASVRLLPLQDKTQLVPRHRAHKNKSEMWLWFSKRKLLSDLILSELMCRLNSLKLVYLSVVVTAKDVFRKKHLLTNSFIKLPHVGKLKPDVDFKIKAQ